jgi:hypothetical protein
MLAQYYTLDGTLLLERPQDAIPQAGDLVPVAATDGHHQTYRVHHCRWPLKQPGPGRMYYALRDASDCLVEIYLEESAEGIERVPQEAP